MNLLFFVTLWLIITLSHSYQIMDNNKKIKTALISVYYKDGLEYILKLLDKDGVTFVSTGGTRDFIESKGYKCIPVESLTGYPSILGGRVKTLHPKIFGGILSRRQNETDIKECEQYDIPSIDLVIVDLYPFSETVASGATQQEIIEKIDIGGISLIRAAAKNYEDVVIVASKKQYAALTGILDSQGANTDINQRRWFAREAFAVSSEYDSAIFNYFDSTFTKSSALRIAIDGEHSMRYGENPHQQGCFYGNLNSMFEQLHGKELSYNNLLDVDAATSLIWEFTETTFAILKHNNACGVATRPILIEAWKAALACDPVSAFGGVLITNHEVDAHTAAAINEIFFEVIIAPGFSDDALTILKQKKNRIILVQKHANDSKLSFRSVLNGAMVQGKDMKTENSDDLQCVTNMQPDVEQIQDLIFANKIVKHSKSNAIVLAKDNQLLASGVGQTSRVDALKQAIAKARSFGFSLDNAVMASDAFFPFADCVEIAAEAGIKAVIQPGGSIRDNDSVEFCNGHDIAMVMTGVRHFKH